ncbi:MAG TPA: M23 family peptidase, partial [Mycobacterium sp.]|nr:M23 family peptidase [Mycobacterium sp.]
MRVAAFIVAVSVACAAPAEADDGRLTWPLRPRPAVLRLFDAPTPNWQRG